MPFNQPLPPRRHALLGLLAFALPLLLWSLVSYVPALWGPMMRVTNPGGVTWLQRDALLERQAFADASAKLTAAQSAKSRAEDEWLELELIREEIESQ